MTPEEVRPWKELRSTGLLWLINAALLHPRGFAMAIVLDKATEEPIGWKLLGDGTEPWQFGDNVAERFRNVEATLAAARLTSLMAAEERDPERCNHLFDHPGLGMMQCVARRRHEGPHENGSVTWTAMDHREPAASSPATETTPEAPNA